MKGGCQGQTPVQSLHQLLPDVHLAPANGDGGPCSRAFPTAESALSRKCAEGHGAYRAADAGRIGLGQGLACRGTRTESASSFRGCNRRGEGESSRLKMRCVGGVSQTSGNRTL